MNYKFGPISPAKAEKTLLSSPNGNEILFCRRVYAVDIGRIIALCSSNTLLIAMIWGPAESSTVVLSSEDAKKPWRRLGRNRVRSHQRVVNRQPMTTSSMVWQLRPFFGLDMFACHGFYDRRSTEKARDESATTIVWQIRLLPASIGSSRQLLLSIHLMQNKRRCTLWEWKVSKTTKSKANLPTLAKARHTFPHLQTNENLQKYYCDTTKQVKSGQKLAKARQTHAICPIP